MSTNFDHRVWGNITSPAFRSAIEQLANEASVLSAHLRVGEDSTVEDAARFLMETLRDGSMRLELAGLEVARVAKLAGVPGHLLSEWSGISIGALELNIAHLDQARREQGFSH